MALFSIGNFDILGGGGAVGGVSYKGSVATKAYLDAMTDMANGDIWLVTDENKKYVWSENDREWQLYSDAGLSEADVRSIINSSVAPLLNAKVDKEAGKSLMSDEEHEKLRNALTEHQSLEGYVQKVPGKGLSTVDLTEELKAEYDEAYTHSRMAHAPADAERNVITSVKVNGTEVEVAEDRSVDIEVSVVPTPVSKPSVVFTELPSSVSVGEALSIKAAAVKGDAELTSLSIYVGGTLLGNINAPVSGTAYGFTYQTQASDAGKTVKVKAEAVDASGFTGAAEKSVTVASASGYRWEIGYRDAIQANGPDLTFDEAPYVKLAEGYADPFEVSYTYPATVPAGLTAHDDDLTLFGWCVFKYTDSAPDLTEALNVVNINEISSFTKTTEDGLKVYTYLVNEEAADIGELPWTFK